MSIENDEFMIRKVNVQLKCAEKLHSEAAGYMLPVSTESWADIPEERRRRT
jgi:hypothetical protein